ncbi:MAG TPA: DUF4331 family protein [Thermomicrobiaceae bacterium]|nr:DUF4331 family protein [Thermomicrobiaceae bacterium]
MSHHYSGPDFSFPQGDARLDLTDLYAFPKPGEAGTSILIMDAHPSSGVNPPGPTTTEPFAPGAIYELKIDTNGDAVPDIAYRVQFSSGANGKQTATVRRAEGAEAAGDGFGGESIVEGAPVSTGRQAQITEAGPYRFFAGWRSDPFFFDAAGALNNFQFTGDDFFADKDVCSIAFELPNPALGGGPVALWFRTLMQSNGSGWTQADRGARPQQSVFFSPGDEKASYLAGKPVDDAQFIERFAHTLEQAGGYSPQEARRVAGTMLPDELRYDPSQPAAFPRNGRRPTDDAPDGFLAVFTNGKVTTDGVGPHTDLLDEFPYLGPPHRA